MEKDKMPRPLVKSTIEEIMDAGGDTSEKPYKVFIGDNLGGRTFALNVPMHELYEISEVANIRGKNGEAVAQRPLDISHARKLALYMLKGLVMSTIIRLKREKKVINDKFYSIQEKVGKQPYLSLQPIVANLRSCDPEGKNIRAYRLLTSSEETAGFKIFLSQKDVFWIVDGQHRRKAMQEVFDFLKYVASNRKYPGKGSIYPANGYKDEISAEELQVWHECFETARVFNKIVVELHLGLTIEQERQLFHDLNNLGKKPSTSLALQFDNSNPVNIFIKEDLIGDILIDWTVVEDKNETDWEDDSGTISLKQLASVNARLMLNKNNASGVIPALVEKRKEIAKRFWHIVAEIPGINESQAKVKTIAAQPVVLKAMAKLVYDFAFNPRGENKELLEKTLNNFLSIDFSHNNPMWRYYEFSDAERETNGLSGLKEYLPSEEEGFNRDIGKYDSKNLMRFGSKHNDIFPILADMMRWKLGLPNRRLEA